MDREALRVLIQGGETATLEFKVASPRAAELAERICGFANSLGGMLIIGVEDKTCYAAYKCQYVAFWS